MAKVTALCGMVASGKTTYAKSFKTAVILSPDDLMLGLFDGCLGDKHDETLARISRYFFKLSLDIIAAGVDVVLDFGFWTDKARDEFSLFFKEKGIPHELHYLDIPDGERRERLSARNKLLSSSESRQFIIDDETLAFLDGKFSAPKFYDVKIG